MKSNMNVALQLVNDLPEPLKVDFKPKCIEILSRWKEFLNDVWDYEESPNFNPDLIVNTIVYRFGHNHYVIRFETQLHSRLLLHNAFRIRYKGGPKYGREGWGVPFERPLIKVNLVDYPQYR